MGSPSLFLSHSHLKLKLNLRVYLTNYTIAVVAYYVKKMVVTCLPMIKHWFDTVIVA